MGKFLSGKIYAGYFHFIFLFFLLFFAEKSFGQQGGITSIYTDYQGYWNSSSTAINPIKPNNDHNVIGFSWNGATYSTGVNDAALTAKGVNFSPVVFQAFPVRNIALTGSSRIILGQLKDGVDNGVSTPAPFTSPPQISNFLTDGIQGLNIGTGVIDVPASTPLIFDFGAIIDVNKINDGIPDLLISQVGFTVAGTPPDNIYFVDANGNRVGNIVSIDQSQVPFVGNWTADLYDLNGTITDSRYINTPRELRVWAADVSVFGINVSNYATVTALKYELKGYSDPAFLAFNTSIIQILSANDDAATTNMATPVDINVLNNDVPSSAIDASSVIITTQPQHGSCTVSSTGVVTYRPNAGYYGTDNFVYKVSNNGNSQSDIAQVTVTVGGPVAAPVFDPGLTASRCAGAGSSAYTATATNSTGITYTLSPAAAGSIDASSGLVTWSAAFSGTATITATASGQGGPQSSTYTVTVNPIPDAPTANNQTICSGSNTTLTATAPGGTYNWYAAASGGTSLFTGASFATPNLTSTTTYYVDATSAAGCISTRTAVTVTVNPIPAAPTASGATICSGSTATLTATAPGGTYNWYATASGGTSLAANASFTTPNLTANTTYYVDVTSASGCTSPRTAVTVTVNPIPPAPTASGTTICSGSTATLTATAPGGTYNWYATASGGTSLSANASFTTPNLTANTTYYVDVTSASGCTSPRTAVTVTVNPIPPAPTASGAIICSGSTATLTATAPGGTYNWYATASGGTSLAANASFTTPNLTANTTYYVDVTSASGCTSPRTAVTVTVNPIPPAPTASGTTICSGSTATLTATAPGGTYNWYATASGGTSLSANASFTTPNLTANTTYYVDVTSASGCTSPRTAVTVTVNPIPAAPTASGTTICSGNSATLTASGSAGTYEWFDAASGGTSLSANASFTTTNLTSTTTYYVQTTVNGCISPRTAVIVTVNPIPAAPTASGTTICSGNSATLTASGSGGTYNWYAAASGGTSLAANASFTTTNLTSTTTYYVQTTVNGCISPRTAVTVTVNPIPAAPTASGTTICSGNSATLTASGSAGTYEWFDAASGGTSLSANASFTTTNLTSTTTYYVQTTVNGCISPRTAVIVTVNPIPAAPTASGTTICSGNSATLTASGSGGTYEWFDAASGGTSLAANASFTTPFLTSTTTYYVQATVNGCISPRTAVTVTVNPIPAAPTASGTTICNNTTATLTATAPGGTYNWYAAASGGNLLFTGASFTTPFLTSSTTYYVDATSAEGCTGSRTAVTVTVLPPTDPAFNYPSNTFCKTGTNPVPVTASSSGGTFSASPAGLIFADNHTGEINLNASTAGSYTITFVTNTTCVYSSSSSITITNGPDAAFSYSGPYCQQQTNPLPTLPAGSTAGMFSSPDPGIVFVSSGTGEIDLQQSLPGTYTVRNDIAAAGGCAATFAITTVTINPLPIVNAGSDQVVCSGQIVTLSGSIGGGASSATWSGGTGTFSNPSSLHTIYTPGAGETSATLFLTTNDPAGPCGAAVDELQITVKPTPSVTSLASAAICNETAQNYTITSNVSGTTFSWGRASVAGISNASVIGQTSNTITETLVNTTSAPVAVTYTIVPEVNGCTGNQFQYVVTVNPTATVTSAASAVICNQTAQNYTVTSNVSGTTFSWSRAAVAGISNASFSGQTSSSSITETLNNITASPISVTYMIVPEANSCTGTPFNYEVTVNPMPIITSPASAVSCNQTNQNYTITSNVNTATFSWGRSAVAGISNAAVSSQSSNTITEALDNTTSSPVSVTYVIIPEANGCAGTAFNYTITVNPTPALSNTSFNQVICSEGSSVPVTLTSDVNGANFTWTATASAGIKGYTGSGTAIIPAQTLVNAGLSAGTVTYTIKPFYNGCEGITSTYIITVNPKPAVNSAASAVICNQTAQNYTITSNINGATFSWGRAAVAGIGNPAVNGQTSNTITETLVNTTSAPIAVTYIIVPEANGCAGAAFNYTVTVNPTPAVTSATSVAICNQTPQNYTITSDVSGTTFTWGRLAVSGISNPAVSGQTSNTITEALVNTTSAPVAVTYNIIPEANGCTGTTFNYTVTVKPTPTVTSAASAAICNRSAQNYILTSDVSGTTFNWSRAAVAGISNAAVGNQTSNTITEALVNTTSAPVTVTYNIIPEANGCTGAAFNYTVTVNPTPTVTSAASAVICNQSAQNYTLTSDVSGTTFNWGRAAVAGISNASVSGQTSNTITEALVNTTSAPIAVTYTIVPEANGCTGVSFDYKVTVNPTSTVTSASSETICNQTAQNYTITSNVSGTTFIWGRAAVAGISNAAVNSQTSNSITELLTNTTSSPIAVTYTIVPEANGCNGTSFRYEVTVNPTPALSNTSFNQVICSEGSSVPVTLTSDVSGTNFTWTATASVGITGYTASGTDIIPAQTLVNAGLSAGTVTYTVKPFYNSCEGVNSTYTITVNPKPATPLVSSNSPVCNGTSLMLTTPAVAGAIYTWTGPNGFTSNLQNPEIANASAAAQGTYSLTITVNSCTGNAGTTTVTVNPTPPTPVAGSNGPICAGETLNLTASNIPGATYSWTGPNGFTSSVQNPVINNAQVTSSGTYTVKATVNGCISTAGTIAVVVNAIPPAPTVSSNSPVCATTNLNLTAASIAGANYNWTGPNGFTSTLQNPVISSATPANSGTYYVTTVSADGCTSPASSITVLVNPLPAEPVLTSNSPVCSGNSIVLTCTAYPGIVYQWTGPNSFTSNRQNPVIDNAETVNQGRYTVVITTPGCTVANTAFIDVKVNQTPAAPVAGSNSPVCAGQTLKLSATTVAGAIYTWSGPNGFISHLQNPEIADVNSEQGDKYFVTVTVNGCTSATVSTAVIVNKPSVVVAGNAQTVCANNPAVALSGSINGSSTTGIWSTTGSGTFTTGNTNLKGTYVPSAADVASGSVTLTLRATNTSPCAIASASFKLTIIPVPVVFAGNDQDVCINDQVTLNGKITNSNGSVWSSSGTGIFSPSNTSLNALYIPNEKDKAEGIVTLTLTATGNGNCTIVSDQMKIRIVPPPKVNAGQDIYVMQDEHMVLQPAVSGTDLKYNWTPNLYLNNPTLKNPTLTGTEDITYTLTVTGSAGCVAQDQVFVKVLKPITIPNTFTPNNDGINDTWAIKELYNYPDITVKIFNRYGMQLFYSQGYGTPWDGTYNGQPLPVGTYYYIIDLKTYSKLRSGPVTIIR